jgi:hypothetical protein
MFNAQGLSTSPANSSAILGYHPRAAVDYQAFGLTFRSSLDLPAPRIRPVAMPDVHIGYGAVAPELSNAVIRRGRHQAAPGEWLLSVNGVARYHVRDGCTVMIDRQAGANNADVLLFLLGSVLGALFHQRDDLVLHGSAVDAGDGAVGFLGVSGSGKSTLAAALRQRGYDAITDDLCVLRSDAGGVLRAQPGLPQMKLWLDALERLDIAGASLPRVGAGLDKRALQVQAGFAGRALPLKRLYVLEPAETDRVALTPLDGAQKFQALADHTYRLSYLEGLGTRANHFRRIVDVAGRTPIAVVRRPRSTWQLDALVDRLVTDFAA